MPSTSTDKADTHSLDEIEHGNGLRSILLNTRGVEIPHLRVSLARMEDSFCLSRSDDVSTLDVTEHPIWAVLTVLAEKEPFPGNRLLNQGEDAVGEMFWAKTFSENEGILDQLVQAGWLRKTGREMKQAYVTLPMVSVELPETALAHSCAFCNRFESPSDPKRMSRCSRCKRRWYCDEQHQLDHWDEHKRACKLLRLGRYAEVENEKRRKMNDFMSGKGM